MTLLPIQRTEPIPNPFLKSNFSNGSDTLECHDQSRLLMTATECSGSLMAPELSPYAERIFALHSIFREKQLGLKLVWTKVPGQVLMIDHVEHDPRTCLDLYRGL